MRCREESQDPTDANGELWIKNLVTYYPFRKDNIIGTNFGFNVKL